MAMGGELISDMVDIYDIEVEIAEAKLRVKVGIEQQQVKAATN